jgi:hypothetical protein
MIVDMSLTNGMCTTTRRLANDHSTLQVLEIVGEFFRGGEG